MNGYQWYALRVAVGMERHLQALTSHMTRGKIMHVSAIAAPFELDKKRKVRVLYPGYLFIRMRLQDDGTIFPDIRSFFCTMPHCDDFIGQGTKPTPLEEKLRSQMMNEGTGRHEN